MFQSRPDLFIVPGTSLGSLIYWDGGAWVSLNPGTSGYFLKTMGLGAPPLWAPAPTGTGPDRVRTSGTRASTGNVTLLLPNVASYAAPCVIEINMALSNTVTYQSVYCRIFLSPALSVWESTFSVEGAGAFFNTAVPPTFTNVAGDLQITLALSVVGNPVTYRISALEA